MWPAIIAMLGQYFASSNQASGAINAANTSADSTREGMLAQQGFARAMGNSQYQTGQDLQGQLPNLLAMFNQGAPNVSQYFDPSKVNNYYNQATQNLNQNVGANVNQAQSQAGEYAASRGFANPGAFTFGQGNAVRQGFAPQYGQIEQGRAGAMQQLDQNTYNALAQQALQRAGFGQLDYSNKMGIANFSSGFNPKYFNPEAQRGTPLFGGGMPNEVRIALETAKKLGGPVPDNPWGYK